MQATEIGGALMTGELGVDAFFAAQVAEYLGNAMQGKSYHIGHIYNLKAEGDLVPDYFLKDRPVWLKSTLDEWIAIHARPATEENGNGGHH